MSLNNEELLIRGSRFSKSFQTGICKNINVIAGSIRIKNGVISGLQEPINQNDLLNKNFVDDSFNLNEKITNINRNNNVDLTPQQILSGFINRNIPDNIDKTDFYPSLTEIKQEIGIKPIFQFKTIIFNESNNNNLTINLESDGLNILNENKIPTISPQTFILIYHIVGENNITIQYTRTFSLQIPQIMYEIPGFFNMNSFIRTGESSFLNLKRSIVRSDSNINYNPDKIINSSITRIYNDTAPVLTDTFPSSTDIYDYLNMNTNFLDNTYSFSCTFLNDTGANHTLILGSGTSFDSNSSSNPSSITLSPNISLIMLFVNNGNQDTNITVYIIRKGRFTIL